MFTKSSISVCVGGGDVFMCILCIGNINRVFHGIIIVLSLQAKSVAAASANNFIPPHQPATNSQGIESLS